MNASERKAKLRELVATKEGSHTGIPIMYHGVRKEFDAYEIPLKYLIYNPYNGRIGSVVKSYERQHHIINPEDHRIRN